MVEERLLADVEDVVSEGHVRALKADAAARRVGKRLEAVVVDLEMASAAHEARRLRGQKRRIEESVRHLRDRLGLLRSVVAKADGVRAGAA